MAINPITTEQIKASAKGLPMQAIQGKKKAKGIAQPPQPMNSALNRMKQGSQPAHA
jgi:hypothetical protein